MKKIIITLILIMLFSVANVFAESEVIISVTYDGKEIVPEAVMAVYSGETNIGEANHEGTANVLVMANDGDIMMLLMKTDVEIMSGENNIDFKSTETKKINISIGENVTPLDDSVFIDFLNLPPESSIELKLPPKSEKEIVLSNALDYLIAFTDIKGNTGINISTKNTTQFNGNYYLKQKTENVIMENRPSFEHLFDICYGDNEEINDMFTMGQGGGCDYKYFDKDGNVVLESRFGHVSNGLHFENLENSLYDMEFNFNNGDLILTAKDVSFKSTAEETSNIDNSLEIKSKALPLSDSDIDFHMIMETDESHIVFNLDKNDIDGNVLNQDDIDLFYQNNKTFSVKNDFVEVSFDKNIIEEMTDTNYDLSMHIFKGKSFNDKNSAVEFMNSIYDNVNKMTLVGDYNVQIFLNEYDLICGEWNNRPEITFSLAESELKGIDFRKVNTYVSLDDDKMIDLVYSINGDNSITLKLDESINYPYINLYEDGAMFSDIDNSWAKDYIEVMASKGVINGVGNGLYKPTDTLTKAQFITLVVKGMNFERAYYSGIFEDCKEAHWYTSYIETAYKNGLIYLNTDVFNPNYHITREDMAVISVKAYEKITNNQVNIESTKDFVDAKDISKQSKMYIDKAVSIGILDGMPDGTFRPKDTLTREQAAKIVYKLINLIS